MAMPNDVTEASSAVTALTEFTMEIRPEGSGKVDQCENTKERLCGESSSLCVALGQIPNDDADQLQDALKKISLESVDDGASFAAWFCGNCFRANESAMQAKAILDCLRTILQATRTSSDVPAQLLKAIETINSVWQSVRKIDDANVGDLPALEKAIASKRNEQFAEAFWIVRDIWARLGKEAEVGSDASIRQATAPILLWEKSGTGVVASLTVELIPENNSAAQDIFVPDLLRMGLVTFPPAERETADEPACFRTSMKHAWDCSGAGKLGFRGRWYVSTFKRGQLTERNSAAFHGPELGGRSAEAAAISAIWAALGGMPTGETRFDELPDQELLDQGIAISATVTENSDGRNLGAVASEYQKCEAAYKVGIDTVLLKNLPSGAPAEGHLDDQRTGVRLFSFDKMEDAFNDLLVSGPLLKDYKQAVAADWLDRWLNPEDAARTDLSPDSLPVRQESGATA